MDLPGLVARVTEIEKQEKEAEDSGNYLPEETFYEKEVVSKLIAGRVDQAAELRSAVESRIEALKTATQKAVDLLEKLDLCFIEAIKLSGSTRLDGLAWSAKIQNNSKASVVIEDESKIPVQYKHVNITIKERVPASDEANQRLWASMILKTPLSEASFKELSAEQKEKVYKCFDSQVNKTLIEASLKKDPNSVPGARLDRGQHLRVVKGDAKPKTLEDKKNGN